MTARVLTSVRWRGKLETAYDRAVAEWLQEADPARGEDFYRRRVFPLGCERMRQARAGIDPLDLLFVPVGTQPYAPILAILGNPARCIALIETQESAAYGTQVENALASTSTVLHVRVAGAEIVNIGNQMKAVYDARGLPSGARVGADITGGRKPMTAAISGVGCLYGWRLFYVEGKQERDRMGYAHHEQIVELRNVLDVFGDRRREKAMVLLASGQCPAAARVLKEVIEDSVASGPDRTLLRRIELSALWRDGETEAFARDVLGECARLHLPCAARVLLEECTARGRVRDKAHGALLWAAAREALAVDAPVAAKELLTRASRLLRRSLVDLSIQSLPGALRQIAAATAIRDRRRGLAAIDRLFGAGLRKAAAVRP